MMSDEFFSFSTETDKLLNEFEAYLRSEGQRLNTTRGNVRYTASFLAWLDTQGINYREAGYTDLMFFISYNKARGNAKNTINGKLQGVRHFYNYLQQIGQVESNPCEELRLKGVIRRQPHDLPEWEELEQLYREYPTGSITGKRNKAILGMMIYQGLNSGEVAVLELKDIKLEEGKVYIPGVGRSNSRTLSLEPFQVLQMQKYISQVRPVILALTEKESEKLFISSGTGHRLDNSLAQLMKAARKLSPTIRNPKQVRAAVITYWLKRYHIRRVQYMTGHRYVSSTERYRTDRLESLQEQIDELHPLK